MFRIEDNLLIKKDKVELSLLNVIDQYYKEMHMLISNIHLTHVLMKENTSKVFPLETNLYDGSWYKNLLVSANIIYDRLHMVVDENLPYDAIFNEKEKCDFKALANVWNKINFIVKYNLPDNIWNEKANSWNLISTSRKIEELIATNVDVNNSLLETISFDLSKYKSIPKSLSENEQHSYNDLVNTLTNSGPSNFGPQAPGFNKPAPNNFGQQPFNPNDSTIQTPTGPVSSSDVNRAEKGEKPPIHPLKKELDAIVKWVDFKQENVKAYVERKKLGYDPNEYKRICEMLPLIEEEITDISEILSSLKSKIPLDPLKSEMDKLVRWTLGKEKYVRLYKKNKNINDGEETTTDSLSKKQLLRQELEKIVKTLKVVNDEINLIENELGSNKNKLPRDPAIKELSKLLRWVDAKQKAVNIYKRNLRRLNSIDSNDELARIEREMQIINERLVEIDNLEKASNLASQQIDYENELNLIKDKLSEVNKDLNYVDEQAFVLDPSSGVNNDVIKTKENNKKEVNKKNNDLIINPDRLKAKKLVNWISKKEHELLLLQKRLTNRLNLICKYDEKIIKFRNEFINAQNKLRDSQVYNVSTDSNDDLFVEEVISTQPINDNQTNIVIEEKEIIPINLDEEIKLINDQQDLINHELDDVSKKINDTKPLEINDNQTLEANDENNHQQEEVIDYKQLFNDDDRVIEDTNNLINQYNVEAEILKKAFEILPDDLKQSANSQLPQMIDLLLEEGYINKKEDKDNLSKQSKK